MTERLKGIFTSLPFLGLLVALLSWPVFPLTPGPGVDPSWGGGLHMATHEGLVFGREIVFTYGPLGFLTVPTLWYEDLGSAAVVYSSLVHVAACTLVLWAALRVFGRLLAVIVAVLACSFLGPPLVTVALILSAAVIVGHGGRRLEDAFPFLIGSLAAFAFLLKLNIGVEVFLLGGVALLAAPWRPALARLASFAAIFVFALVLLWLAAGQPLGALVDYVSLSRSVISGHSEAMVLSDPTSGSYAVLAVGGGIAATAAAWLLNGGLERRRRIALSGLVALFAFLAFKEGFIRPDEGHVALFISAMVSAWFVLGWKRPLGSLGIASFAIVIAAAANFQAGAIDPIARAEAARDLARTMLDSSRRQYPTELGHTGIAVDQAVDPEIVAAIGDRPVHVGPFQTAVAWALDLEWQPLPLFQDYLTYTPELDRENAEALRSPDGPELILRHLDGGVVDGRFTAYNPPEATVAMLCNFSARLVRGNWMLLERTAPRCGEERPIGSVEGRLGEPVPVPPAPPGSLVIARVHGVGVGGLERIRTLLFRAKPRYVSFSGGGEAAPTEAAYRLVPATAEDGLLISAPAGADYPGPFELAPDPDALTISGPGLEGEIEVEFYALPIRPAGEAGSGEPQPSGQSRTGAAESKPTSQGDDSPSPGSESPNAAPTTGSNR